MLVANSILIKARRLAETYADLIFRKIADIPVRMKETREHWRTVPAGWETWPISEPGTAWGEPGGSAWFVGEWIIPAEWNGHAIYLRASTDGHESLFWLDGTPRGIFTHRTEAASRGNHHTLLLTAAGRAGARHQIALESYAGHFLVGTQPFDTPATQGHYRQRFPRTFAGVCAMTRREAVREFVFDLKAVNDLVEMLDHDSFRRARLCAGLEEIFAEVYQHPDDVEEALWTSRLVTARAILRRLLDVPNTASAPTAGLIGHSHIDTAWTWTIDETIRKCARTFSNALSLMEQYPEYLFAQSAPFHTEMMRLHYPPIFSAIKDRIAEGRWEPLGGMWIECDCNLVSGESMIRQFLLGIRYTLEHFSYRPDTFWLPDTFGYSAALPQIMAGFGLRYFLTTKLSWNDTNTFPYDTFRWQGLDGSEVLVHFNETQCAPDPATLIEKLHGGSRNDFRHTENYILHKEVNDRRLISYGYGDGGGGPTFEMIEMAARCRDTEGCPRGLHSTVSQFMQELAASSRKIPAYSGELYFEGHRGTLTQMHALKRGNRKAELLLRELEFLSIALPGKADPATIDALWDTLLINQFHDILPGTSIPEVHDRAMAEFAQVHAKASAAVEQIAGPPTAGHLTLWNSLNWPRSGTLVLHDLPPGALPHGEGILVQQTNDLEGRVETSVRGIALPALGSTSLELVDGPPAIQPSPFVFTGQSLETPLLQATFDAHGYIDSLWDKECRRELRRGPLPLNALLSGEDVPVMWDNWDIDDDQSLKLRLETRVLHREVIGDGPLQFRIRTEYQIGQHSSLRQDMIFHAHSKLVEFDTLVEWRERHCLLKAAFGLNLNVASARQETQFGHVVRPTTRNTTQERAMFEVCQHKWTDLSESRYGVALLNDCKYGISVRGAEMRLSLLKGGCHPDPRGDSGKHRFRYALLPHTGGFSTESVIRPAYEFNIAPTVGSGAARNSLFQIDIPHVVVESIKPALSPADYIIRLYEAEGTAGFGALSFSSTPQSVWITDLLENDTAEIPVTGNRVEISFRPFEIKTLKVRASHPPAPTGRH